MPVLGAAFAGALIGFERDYHGHPAGLRTHILVAMTAALLMLAAVHQMQWMGPNATPDIVRLDPVRMAHGLLTGIGFLCGGVIFRQGLSVHGLTTAASLWATSALGTLYGVGMYNLAIYGTVAVLLVLAVLRFANTYVAQWRVVSVAVSYTRKAKVTREEFDALLSDFKLKPQTLSQRLASSGEVVEFKSVCKSLGKVDLESLVQHLLDDQRVRAFDVTPRKQ